MPETGKRLNDIYKKSRLPLLLIMFTPCFLVLFLPLDNDIWFLLNHGRYVLENGIPHIEPFTIHQGFHFVMQQWLSAFIFWLAYSSLGVAGIKILVMFCCMLTVYIIFKLCMKVSENYFFISFIFTLFVSLVLVLFMTSRPCVFSTPIFVLEFYLLESYWANKNKKYLYLLPILSIILINLHAAMWPMFFVFLVPYIIETFKFKIGPFVGHGVEKKWLYPAVLLSGVVGFLNPYGLEAMGYLFKSYGHEQINRLVTEMQPVDINSLYGKLAIICILIVPLIYCSYKKGIKRLRYILLALGTGYMTMSSNRSLLLYMICAYFPLAAYLKDFEPTVKKDTNPKKTRLIRKVLMILISLLIPFCFYGTYEASKPKNNEYILLDKTVSFILEKNKAENVVLYTGYNNGGMAEFRGIRTYLDPRAEVFFAKNNKKDDVFKEYFDMQAGNLFYKNVTNKYNFTHLILSGSDILLTYLPNDSDYIMTYSNESYALYETRKDIPAS